MRPRTTLWIPVLSVSLLSAGAAAQPTITTTPSSGGLGTVMQFELTPRELAYQLSDATATATWTGVYQPMVGAPSAVFTVDYDASEVIVESPWLAKIILGTGQVTNGPDLLSLGAPGSLVGSIEFTLPYCRADVTTQSAPAGDPLFGQPDGIITGADIQYYVNLWFALDLEADLTGTVPETDPLFGVPDGFVTGADILFYSNMWAPGCPADPIAVSGAADISLSGSGGVWEVVSYPEGPGGLTPPFIDGEPSELQLLLLSQTPNPTTPTADSLMGATDFHISVVVRVEENSLSTSNAPASMTVDLVSLDTGGTEIDRLEDVVLAKLDPDGDPNSIVYHNDLSIPIVLVDTTLNKANYPGFLILKGVGAGSAVILPAD